MTIYYCNIRLEKSDPNEYKFREGLMGNKSLGSNDDMLVIGNWNHKHQRMTLYANGLIKMSKISSMVKEVSRAIFHETVHGVLYEIKKEDKLTWKDPHFPYACGLGVDGECEEMTYFFDHYKHYKKFNIIKNLKFYGH